MTGAAWGTDSGGSSFKGMSPPANNLFIKYATELRGEFFRQGPRENRRGRVLTKVEKWTIVLEGKLDYRMRARYESMDGFAFKVALKGPLHDLLGYVFRSRDIDTGDPVLQEHYSVEANNEVNVRRLLANQQFHNLRKRWGSHWLIERLESSRQKDSHEIKVDIGDTVSRFDALERLLAIHSLVVETLRELADMGSASREPVEIGPPGEGWTRYEEMTS